MKHDYDVFFARDPQNIMIEHVKYTYGQEREARVSVYVWPWAMSAEVGGETLNIKRAIKYHIKGSHSEFEGKVVVFPEGEFRSLETKGVDTFSGKNDELGVIMQGFYSQVPEEHKVLATDALKKFVWARS